MYFSQRHFERYTLKVIEVMETEEGYNGKEVKDLNQVATVVIPERDVNVILAAHCSKFQAADFNNFSK